MGNEKEFELKRFELRMSRTTFDGNSVDVYIDKKLVASFYENGTFDFFGKSQMAIYKNDWQNPRVENKVKANAR